MITTYLKKKKARRALNWCSRVEGLGQILSRTDQRKVSESGSAMPDEHKRIQENLVNTLKTMSVPS